MDFFEKKNLSPEHDEEGAHVHEHVHRLQIRNRREGLEGDGVLDKRRISGFDEYV